MPLAAVLAGIALQGCLMARSLEPLSHDIQSQMSGAKFDNEIRLTLGPVSLFIVRNLARLVPEPEVQHYRKLLSHVSKVEVAVYEIQSAAGAERAIATPSRLRRMTEKEGWQTAVRVNDGSERVWVLYRENKGKVKDIYVATVDTDSLTLVRVKGNLNKIVAWAVNEHPESIFGTDDHPSAPGPEAENQVAQRTPDQQP